MWRLLTPACKDLICMMVMMFMCMIMTTAAISIMMIMLLMVMMAMIIFLPMIVVAMVILLMVMMTMMIMRTVLFFHQLLCKRISAIHRLQDHTAGKLIPRSCDNCCLFIMLLQKLLLFHILCTAKHNCVRILYLIIEKFAEILHIYFTLCRIGNCDGTVQLNVCMLCHTLDSSHYI